MAVRFESFHASQHILILIILAVIGDVGKIPASLVSLLAIHQRRLTSTADIVSHQLASLEEEAREGKEDEAGDERWQDEDHEEDGDEVCDQMCAAEVQKWRENNHCHK